MAHGHKFYLESHKDLISVPNFLIYLFTIYLYQKKDVASYADNKNPTKKAETLNMLHIT